MPNREQLYQALRSADAAGDVDGAKKLASYIKTIGGDPVAASPPSNPTDGNSFFQNMAAGIGKGVTDAGLGAKQLLDDSAAYLERHLGGESANAFIGTKNAVDIQRETQAAVNEKRGFDAALMATGGGKVGNFIGTAAPAVAASLIPGAQGLAGALATGGALGAAQPVATGESRLMNTAIGVAGGGVGYGVAKGASRILGPSSATNANLQLLKAEGVQPTVGQTLGGVANRIEQKLQSVPILGDGIVAARSRALNQFDNAAINRATGPIGVKVNGTGQVAVKEAGDALSTAYDDALAQVPHVTLDNQFANDMVQLHTMAQNLVPELRSKFNSLLDTRVLDRVSPQGSMLGDTYKAIDSELGAIAAKYQKSGIASETELGDAISQLKILLNQNMRRGNPQVAATLEKIDEGWANLVRIEQAAKSAKNAEGVFTPAQLNMAVQTADKSTRGRAVSRGDALMQDLSRAGQSVLGGTVPDSGTAGRLAMGGGALATGFLNPAIPIGLAAGAAAYSRPMQSILNAMVGTRPAIAGPVSSAVSKYAATAGALGATGAITYPERRQIPGPTPIAAIGNATTIAEAIAAAEQAADF
jgi:hypothetical protein